MKKDMGGAAHALALAQLVMQARLPVRLHLLIPAVENAIAGNATRPGDVHHSRKGLTVENTNTDAEGRLILADALTKAVEGKPELILDFATLTGAARVALGPDLPPLFVNDEALADRPARRRAPRPATRCGGCRCGMRYDDMLKSDIADLVNAPDGGFAGAVTAALFLRRFVPAEMPVGAHGRVRLASDRQARPAEGRRGLWLARRLPHARGPLRVRSLVTVGSSCVSRGIS